jgi:hypothetical protein
MANEQDIVLSRFTPINDDNKSCARTCAELRIYSGDIHPLTVTHLLGISPTSVVAKGEKSPPNSLGRSRVGKINGWFLSSEPNVQSKDLRRHLDWLMKQLWPASDALRALQAVPGIRMYVYCPWWSEDGGGGPALWPEQMKMLAELNLECTIDFADYSESAVGS